MTDRKPLIIALVVAIAIVLGLVGFRKYLNSIYESQDFRNEIHNLIAGVFREAGARVDLEIAPLKAEGLSFHIPRITFRAKNDRDSAMTASEIKVEPAIWDLLFSKNFSVRVAGKLDKGGSFNAEATVKSDLGGLLSGGAVEVRTLIASAMLVDIAQTTRVFYNGIGGKQAKLKSGICNLNLKYTTGGGILNITSKDIVWTVGSGAAAREIKGFLTSPTFNLSPTSAQLKERVVLVLEPSNPLRGRKVQGKVVIEGGFSLAKGIEYEMQVSSKMPLFTTMVGRLLGCKQIPKRPRYSVRGSLTAPNCT